MPIKRLSQTSLVSFQKHSNMLAGNPAYSPPVFDLLETTVLGTAAASVTFSNLGSYSDYKHLQIRGTARVTNANNQMNNIQIVVNSDNTAANYCTHYLRGNGTAVDSGTATGLAQIYLLAASAGGSTTASSFGAFVFDLLDFGNTSKNKTTRTLAGGTSGNNRIILNSGLWISTNAVTSITLQDENATNFVAGSRFSLYGIR